MNSNAPTTILDVGYIYKITSDEDDKIYYGSSKDVKENGLITHYSMRV